MSSRKRRILPHACPPAPAPGRPRRRPQLCQRHVDRCRASRSRSPPSRPRRTNGTLVALAAAPPASPTCVRGSARPRPATPPRRTAPRRAGPRSSTALAGEADAAQQARLRQRHRQAAVRAVVRRAQQALRRRLDQHAAAPAPPAPGRCAPSPPPGRGTGAGTRCPPARSASPASSLASPSARSPRRSGRRRRRRPESPIGTAFDTSSSTPSAPTTGVG